MSRSVSMRCLGQALIDVGTKVLEAVHPLHCRPVDIKGVRLQLNDRFLPLVSD